jgi:basic membrane lipoprotein Med (substrate-binding protein (PBP1-ABC) superfamily)
VFNYYNDSAYNVSTPTSVIGSLGGTTIEVHISSALFPVWFQALQTIYIKFHSLYNGYELVYPLGYDPKSTSFRRYHRSATEGVSDLGLNITANMSVSFNGLDYCGTSAVVYIEERLPIRVLLMYNSLVDDHGWTSAHNSAKLLAANYFSVALNIDIDEEVNIYNGGYIEARAASGAYDVIFVCTDFSSSIIVPIAQQFPRVTFVLVTNSALMDHPPVSHNLVFTTCLLNEGIYLTGVVAGNMIPQGGLVCLIKGFDVSSVQQGINAFALGLFKYNPTARFKTTTINSWTDYYQEAQAAERFYAMGCDLISHQTSHAKTMGVFTTKKKFG